jgi:serine/threonine-protein kinase
MHRKVETLADGPGDTVAPGSGVITAPDFAPGRVIGGKYLVEHVIGEGGIGVVLKAKHVQLEQPVAIKHLRPEAAARPDIVERFLREARLAAKIKNEHAVKVQDVDAVESGVPYMVMEFLEGRDLEQIVVESPLTVDVAIDYVLQACEALAEAHALGIVHRDIKPANLFVAAHPGSTSVVKILDFGISKMTTKDRASQERVTRIDERIGTPVFMSPEQLQADPDVDARSDIWSLGVVLYELVTGRLPFDGPDLPQVCVAIMMQPPVPLSAVHPDAPPELEAVIARCLQKDRAQRYQNIAELAQDLTQIWQGDSPSRVKQITRVISEAGHKISPPTPFPGSIEIPVPLVRPAAPDSQPPEAAPPVEESPVAVPPPPVPALASAAPPAPDSERASWIASEQSVVEDCVLAVFSDAAGAELDEMEFLSIDEAYEYAASQGAAVVRCDLYDQFAGVRGKLRVTYMRRAETGLWVPLIT